MYESFYGLKGKPFQLNPDPEFFYGSRGHKRAYAYLEYGLYQGEGFIVITGEVGAGKTTLVCNLLDHLDSRRLVAAQLVSTQLDADDLLRSVATAFGLRSRDVEKSQLLAELEAFLLSVVADRKRALLFVDEAQNLTPRAVEELRMLSNFQVGDQALLQSFLIGQPELRDTMRSPQMQQLRQRVIASYHLGPLDAAETRGYIEHRLTHVGWKGVPRFEPEALEAIYAFTRGIPRRINTLCNRLMLAGFLAERTVFGESDVSNVVNEIRDELGTEALAPRKAQVSFDPAQTGAEVSPTFPPVPDFADIDRSRIHVDEEHAASITQIVKAAKNMGLEERVVRLERTMMATLNLLQRLIRTDAPVQHAGKPEEQSRS